MKYCITLVFFLLLTGIGCSGNTEQEKQPAVKDATTSKTVQHQEKAFQSIDPKVAKFLLDSRDDILLIDVRTPRELRVGSIEGATMMPFWSVAKGQANLPRDKAIMLVCAVGGRSYAAGMMLAKNGYKEVYNLSGGISAWKRAGLPVNIKTRSP